MYCEEIRPYWLLVTKGYGLNVDDIDWSCPADLEPYSKAYKLQMQQQDSQLYTMGIYALSAVKVAIEHCLAGKKAKSEYIKEPLLSKSFENEGLTKEQIHEKEIKKAILAEQQYIAIAFSKGLPETIIL